jgi:hypothetical protein
VQWVFASFVKAQRFRPVARETRLVHFGCVDAFPVELASGAAIAPYPRGWKKPTPTEAIRAWMLFNRYTVADAARALGLTERTVHDVLGGRVPGRLSTAQAFRAAGVALDDWPRVVR